MDDKNKKQALVDDKSKKQVPLRLSASLWKELVSWAEDDFRSLNGQIEYLLNECVKRRGRRAAAPSVEGEGAGESES